MKKASLLIIILLVSLNVYSQQAKSERFKERFLYHGRPAVELSYGQANESVKDFNMALDKYGHIELKLGYYYEGVTEYAKNISRYKNTFISPFNFYHSGSISWTSYDRYKLLFEPWETPTEIEYLSRFGDKLRFGNSTEAGIALPVSNNLRVNAKFERSLVYPRHLFWKWLGSAIIEAGGQEAVDAFVKAIMRSSPNAGPVMSFLLKNGLAYGLYELRRSKMYWPFNSGKPLLFDTYKIGLNVIF
jgi:hypothetical protein